MQILFLEYYVELLKLNMYYISTQLYKNYVTHLKEKKNNLCSCIPYKLIYYAHILTYDYNYYYNNHIL